LFANAATQQTSIDGLTSNAATQAGQIAVLDANLGTATTNITTLFANAAAQATSINTLTANAATQSIAIDSLATGANANTAAYLPGYSGDLNSLGNVTILGSLTSDDITSLSVYVQGNAIITGNLTVLGNTTTINSNVITTNDKNITVANNVTVNTQLDGAGLDAGQNAYATWRYNYLTDSWQSNLSVTPTTDATKNLGGTSNRWGTVYAQTLASDTIDTINANLGTATTNITTLFSNAATQSIAIDSLATGANANTAAYLTTYTGNIQAYNFTATNSFRGTYFDAVNSAGGSLRNSAGTALIQWGAGGGTNIALNGATNINPANAQVDISPTGTGSVNIHPVDHLDISPVGYGIMNNVIIGNVTPKSGIFTTLQTSGNITANSGAYFVGDGSALTGIAFNGNLAGQTLIDSVRGRVFANAYPDSQGNILVGGVSNVLQTFANVPVYSGTTLLPQGAGSQSQQTVNFITAANVGLRSSYQTSNQRTSSATTMYAQITPVTANVMVNQDRFRGHNHTVELVNYGTQWGTMSAASNGSTNMVSTNNTLNLLGYGNVNHAIGTCTFIQNVPWNGSSNVQYATGYWSDVTNVLNAGSAALPSNIGTARLYGGRINASANLTITNAIALHTHSGWWGSTGVTNKYVVLNEDVNTVLQTAGNITATGANVTLSGFLTTSGNSVIGAPGATQLINGNVIFQSSPPYNTQFMGNVVQGATGSFNRLLGTTLVQGNISFDAPYYETISNSGAVSGTITVNTGLGNSFTLLLTGDITLNTTNFTNLIAGKSITLTLIQDSTGGRILSSNMKFAGGINTLSSAAGAIDVLNVYYDGTRYLASLVKGYV
jgi:hypothetical protein